MILIMSIGSIATIEKKPLELAGGRDLLVDTEEVVEQRMGRDHGIGFAGLIPSYVRAAGSFSSIEGSVFAYDTVDVYGNRVIVPLPHLTYGQVIHKKPIPDDDSPTVFDSGDFTPNRAHFFQEADLYRKYLGLRRLAPAVLDIQREDIACITEYAIAGASIAELFTLIANRMPENEQKWVRLCAVVEMVKAIERQTNLGFYNHNGSLEKLMLDFGTNSVATLNKSDMTLARERDGRVTIQGKRAFYAAGRLIRNIIKGNVSALNSLDPNRHGSGIQEILGSYERRYDQDEEWRMMTDEKVDKNPSDVILIAQLGTRILAELYLFDPAIAKKLASFLKAEMTTIQNGANRTTLSSRLFAYLLGNDLRDSLGYEDRRDAVVTYVNMEYTRDILERKLGYIVTDRELLQLNDIAARISLRNNVKAKFQRWPQWIINKIKGNERRTYVKR